MLGLRTCIYKVPNLAEATAWYTLNFGEKPYFEEPFYVGFDIGGFELGLQPQEQGATKGDNVLIYWGVKDIQKIYDQMLDNGATAVEAPHGVGGPLMAAAVRDPWDNIIGLIYNPLFKADNIKKD